MSICKVCTQPITKRSPGLQCNGFCARFFHANSLCSDVAKNQLTAIENLPGGRWACGQCRGSQSSASITIVDSETEQQGNSEISDSSSNLSQILLELKNEVHLLRDSVNFCSDKVTEFETQLKKLNEYMKLTDALKVENQQLKSEVKSLNTKINSIEQFTRNNNIEIQDVPEKANENLFNIIELIGNYFTYPINKNCIDYITRVPTRIENKPKNIIIKFTSKLFRDGFLAATKAKRTALNNASPGFKENGVSDKLYINDHLTNSNKMLLKEVRETAKTKHYKFVWVQNANILVRKTDSSKILHIASKDDIKKL